MTRRLLHLLLLLLLSPLLLLTECLANPQCCRLGETIKELEEEAKRVQKNSMTEEFHTPEDRFDCFLTCTEGGLGQLIRKGSIYGRLHRRIKQIKINCKEYFTGENQKCNCTSFPKKSHYEFLENTKNELQKVFSTQPPKCK